MKKNFLAILFSCAIMHLSAVGILVADTVNVNDYSTARNAAITSFTTKNI